MHTFTVYIYVYIHIVNATTFIFFALCSNICCLNEYIYIYIYRFSMNNNFLKQKQTKSIG